MPKNPWVWVTLAFVWFILAGRDLPLFGVIVLAVCGAGGWFLLQPHVSQVRAWERLAQETGGEFVDGEIWADGAVSVLPLGPSGWKGWTLLTSPFRSNTVEWPESGGSMILDTDTYPEREGEISRLVKYTRLRAPIPNPDRFRFEIHAAHPAPEPGPGQTLVSLGDPELDRHYIFSTNDGAKARALFASPRLRQLVQSETPVGFRATNEGHRLYLCYDETGTLADLEHLRGLRALFVETLHQLAEIEAAEAPAMAGAVRTATKSIATGDRHDEVIYAAPPSPAPPPIVPPVEVTTLPRDLEQPAATEAQPEPALVAPPTAPDSAPAQSRGGLPTVGDTASTAQWEVTLNSYGPYEVIMGQVPPAGSHGKPMVAEFVARNPQRFTGSFTTSGFSMVDGDGRVIRPAGATASIERGFWLVWVQSGQSVEHRVVFELEPAARNLTLDLLGAHFRLPD